MVKSNISHLNSKLKLIQVIKTDILRNFEPNAERSFNLEPTAELWQSSFTKPEVVELQAAEEDPFTAVLPERLISTMDRLNVEKTFQDIYYQHKNFHVDRHESPELYRVINSITEYLVLFYDNESLSIHTEQDLLEDEVYGFIKRTRRMSNL
ncbi:unnamed protein product [Mucor fragilis]